MRTKFLVVVACSFCFTMGMHPDGNANPLFRASSPQKISIEASSPKKEKPKKGKKKLRKKKKIRKVWW